ncbi:MAG: DUF2809 domain-containing protein [Sphingobacteriaceae bacterium]|nr:MAG: DUF2809 domain-containing protein [Sphingobacteriaceae bacterium]
MSFKFYYFLPFVLLLIVEVLIAIYVHDNWVRPYAGDLLVVIMLYCLVKSLINATVIPAALSVLVFAYLVELSQYFHLVSLLRLENNSVARVVMGSSFSWIDILAYTLGILLVIGVEKTKLNTHKR